MDRIDRYIIRQFILTFLFAILAFVVIYIVVNLMETLDDFFDHNVATMTIVKYYLYFAPDIIQLIVPIAMLLASLFTIGRLDTSNELTAIRAAGRSMRRVALPLLMFGLAVSFGMIYFDGWVVPQTNKLKFAIDRQYLGKNLLGGQRNVYLRVSPTTNLLIEYFDAAKSEASQVSIERFDTSAAMPIQRIRRTSPAEFTRVVDTVRSLKITERIDAPSMRYDSTRKIWVLMNAVARNFSDQAHIATTRILLDSIPLPITPKELNLSQQNTTELSMDELRERIEQEKLGGRDVARLMVDYYSKYSFPFAAFIVVFFGLPFSSGQRKGGAAVQIATTALVSAIYLVLTEISKTFSYTTQIPPMLTAWVVNILFFIVGLFNLYRIERG
ncbi:MAG: Permease YjgP/YjgQ family protein [Chlorobi bacterium]|nr:Permease YjgP/YjgQ family protein [Chlorobiota bacterium]